MFSFKNIPNALKATCLVSAVFYAAAYLIQTRLDAYRDFYGVFAAVDLIWLVLLWRLAEAPTAALAIFCLNATILTTMPLLTSNHWFFYEWYDVNYVILQALFILSITVLPLKWPVVFGVRYDIRDDDSIPRLFKVASRFATGKDLLDSMAILRFKKRVHPR